MKFYPAFFIPLFSISVFGASDCLNMSADLVSKNILYTSHHVLIAKQGQSESSIIGFFEEKITDWLKNHGALKSSAFSDLVKGSGLIKLLSSNPRVFNSSDSRQFASLALRQFDHADTESENSASYKTIGISFRHNLSSLDPNDQRTKRQVYETSLILSQTGTDRWSLIVSVTGGVLGDLSDIDIPSSIAAPRVEASLLGLRSSETEKNSIPWTHRMMPLGFQLGTANYIHPQEAHRVEKLIVMGERVIAVTHPLGTTRFPLDVDELAKRIGGSAFVIAYEPEVHDELVALIGERRFGKDPIGISLIAPGLNSGRTWFPGKRVYDDGNYDLSELRAALNLSNKNLVSRFPITHLFLNSRGATPPQNDLPTLPNNLTLDPAVTALLKENADLRQEVQQQRARILALQQSLGQIQEEALTEMLAFEQAADALRARQLKQDDTIQSQKNQIIQLRATISAMKSKSDIDTVLHDDPIPQRFSEIYKLMKNKWPDVFEFTDTAIQILTSKPEPRLENPEVISEIWGLLTALAEGLSHHVDGVGNYKATLVKYGFPYDVSKSSQGALTGKNSRDFFRGSFQG